MKMIQSYTPIELREFKKERAVPEKIEEEKEIEEQLDVPKEKKKINKNFYEE